MSDKCFIIAELSANHGGDIEIAAETIRAAKRAGADAIKMQTYKPSTMTLKSEKEDFIVQGGTIWDGKGLYELYEEASLPWEWHKELFEISKKEGLVCFSTPFDFTAVDFLEELNCPIYKIASFEINDIPLIQYVASKKKPMIISTGIATYDEIELAIRTCRNEGNNDITLLKCTSSYPAPIEEANLKMIKKFAQDFHTKVGLSDHTIGSIVPILSIAMGAKVIEKHFILDHSIGGPDASFSMDEKEFTQMVMDVRSAESALGEETYELTQKQISGRRFGRSLYVSSNINNGDFITKDNIKSVRPSFGLEPKYYYDVLGKRVNKDLGVGDRLSFEHIIKEDEI
ncbi:pseudaminic acid synthase [Maribacter sp. PR1]|uniref:Pseudaminic acid synthase n=1 Tax=Maribacter cobaltidurans TaxID=1178778 RepID=A0ABU7IQF8_9FLAO|nr:MULTISPECIES: pseudaminic acid synthase [Maribacter]MDC6387800.1 pseudaminic acid synthase [Maribacter sp. PR1]MEE1975188.1 pseudaminic acid synthase [Maribacter cobaltidurans]